MPGTKYKTDRVTKSWFCHYQWKINPLKDRGNLDNFVQNACWMQKGRSNFTIAVSGSPLLPLVINMASLREGTLEPGAGAVSPQTKQVLRSNFQATGNQHPEADWSTETQSAGLTMKGQLALIPLTNATCRMARHGSQDYSTWQRAAAGALCR